MLHVASKLQQRTILAKSLAFPETVTMCFPDCFYNAVYLLVYINLHRLNRYIHVHMQNLTTSTDGPGCRGFIIRMSVVTGSENTRHDTELVYK